MSSTTVCDVPIEELAWRYTRNFSDARQKAIARAMEIRAARGKAHGRTERQARLTQDARAADQDARAASYMIKSFLLAQQTLGEPELRAWLTERLARFDWRMAYERHINAQSS